MTIEEEEARLIRRFNALDDWMARYDYLMLEGLRLPELEESSRTDENRIWGCEAKVWLKICWKEGRAFLSGYSPSLIVRGLVAVMIHLASGRTCEELAGWQMAFFEATGLDRELGEERKRGTEAMLSRIKEQAEEMKAKENL